MDPTKVTQSALALCDSCEYATLRLGASDVVLLGILLLLSSGLVSLVILARRRGEALDRDLDRLGGLDGDEESP